MDKLTKRQQSLVEVAKNLRTTADVGCDHGYIGAKLLADKKTQFLIASDISPLSVDKAKKLLKKHNLSEQSSTRVGFGLDVIADNEQVEQVIIAGMGGKEMIDILSKYPSVSKVKHWVFQPMKEVSTFREYLSNKGLRILQDFIVAERGKYYHIITAESGKQQLSKLQVDFGLNAYQADEGYQAWLERKKTKVQKILKDIPKDSERYGHFEQCLKNIKKIKEGKKLC